MPEKEVPLLGEEKTSLPARQLYVSLDTAHAFIEGAPPSVYEGGVFLLRCPNRSENYGPAPLKSKLENLHEAALP
jgi:hypothetical protein